MTDRIPAHELAMAHEFAVLAVLRSAAEATQAAHQALFPGGAPPPYRWPLADDG